jgi:hypothetical protein
MKFQRKPKPIDAIQWTGNNIVEIDAFFGHEFGFYSYALILESRANGSERTAPNGSWIYRDAEGTYQAIPSDKFTEDYEPA